MNKILLNYVINNISKNSQSFFIASKIFDKTTYYSTLMLYTWCRYCDDIIDVKNYNYNCIKNSKKRLRKKLKKLIIQTKLAFSGIKMKIPAFSALQEIIKKHDINQRFFLEHLKGYSMDVECVSYNTLDDILCYCYHVAGIIGLIMASIMGINDKNILDNACDLGIAFQITNIVRDIIEDYNLGRCYIPINLLKKFGLTLNNYTEISKRNLLLKLSKYLIKISENYYKSAKIGLDKLSSRSACAVATAISIYQDFGKRINTINKNTWKFKYKNSKLNIIKFVISGILMVINSKLKIKKQKRYSKLWQRPII